MKFLVIIFLFFLPFISGCSESSKSVENNEPLPVVEEEKLLPEEDSQLIEKLGWKKKEILDFYGTPDDIFTGNLDQEIYSYGENVHFAFSYKEGIVINMYLKEGIILGVKTGMTFDEIEDVLGEPEEKRWRDGEESYYALYIVTEETTGQFGETEIWIESEDPHSPTEFITILWKGYWKDY